MTKYFAFAGAALIALGSAAMAATVGWHLTAASNVHAFRLKSAILITANVQLANACYEAQIQRSPMDLNPWAYRVMTRVKPGDAGKLCGMVIVPSVARGSFMTRTFPKSVIVHATNKTFVVPLERQ